VPELLTTKDLTHYFKCSRQTLYVMRKLPGFPKPVDKPGDLQWRATDIAAWVAAR
jgi:predicted DNA-binding transcriptional regulator AlpA